MTAEIRARLLGAGAASHGLTPADYGGLRPGTTYYAVDASGVYWAGAALVPESYQAQVSSQDDGAYLLYTKQPQGSWKVFDVGVAGPPSQATRCPVAVPPAVLDLWGWPAGSCHPAGS